LHAITDGQKNYRLFAFVAHYAVNIPSFWDSRFHVIDSVWESEIQRLPGKLRFMAGIFRRMADVGYGCLIRHF
jgi:hypothetical protein